MTTVPENYNTIRAGIVELLKTARSAAAWPCDFNEAALNSARKLFGD